jgi:hypothetical protein
MPAVTMQGFRSEADSEQIELTARDRETLVDGPRS